MQIGDGIGNVRTLYRNLLERMGSFPIGDRRSSTAESRARGHKGITPVLTGTQPGGEIISDSDSEEEFHHQIQVFVENWDHEGNLPVAEQSDEDSREEEYASNE